MKAMKNIKKKLIKINFMNFVFFMVK